MTSPIKLVEQAMLERLRNVPRSYSGMALESYAAQLDDELFNWVRTLPATWVTFGEVKESKRISAQTFRVTATFEVLCAQRALQENAARLNSSAAADIGVYQLLDDNKIALVNQRLGLGLEPITPGGIRPVMKGLANRDAVVVYAQEFKTSWYETYPVQGVGPEIGADGQPLPDGQLISVGFDYFLKPQHSYPANPADSSDLLTTQP